MTTLTVPKAAALLGISQDTARRAINRCEAETGERRLYGVLVTKLNGRDRVPEAELRARLGDKAVA